MAMLHSFIACWWTGRSVVSVSCFGVRVSMMFHFMFVIPPVYEVYRGYIVFAFSVCVCVCVFVCLCVCKLFSVKDFSRTT